MTKIDHNKFEFGVIAAVMVLMSSFVMNMMKLNTFAIMFFALFVLLSFRSWSSFKLNRYSIASISYFIVVVLGLLHSSDSRLELKNIESKLSLLIFPILFAVYFFNKKKLSEYLLKTLVFTTIGVSLFCLCSAIWYYISFKDSSRFFYHEFLFPIKHHAVFFSIAIVLSIIYLLTDKTFLNHKKVLKWLMFAFLWLILLLLSSKLMIIFTILMVGMILFKNMSFKKTKWFAIGFFIMLITVFSFNNPISNRFFEIANSKTSILKQDVIGPEVYLNGLEFRLLQWRNTYDILNNYDAWMFGVSFANSKTSLWEQYDRLKLYRGEKVGEIGGYYQYDLHNQYLQTTLQYGLLGLFVFLVLIVGLINIALKSRNPVLICLAFLFMIFSFTESLLERQYGLILFVFIPLLMYDVYNIKKKA